MQSDGKIVADPTRVKVITRSGPALEESKLITGLALPKKRAHVEMPSSLGAGSILLVDGGLELRSLSTDVQLNVTSTSVLQSFRDAEQKRANRRSTFSIVRLARRGPFFAPNQGFCLSIVLRKRVSITTRGSFTDSQPRTSTTIKNP